MLRTFPPFAKPPCRFRFHFLTKNIYSMKRLMIVLTTVLCSSFFTAGFAQAKEAPYKADYSSKFAMGNPAYADKIVQLWKDWDDNQLERHDYFSDTLTMWLPDGSVTHGKAANLEGAKKYRGSFVKAVSTLHAWVPLYSTDTKDNLVCVWGTEVDTFADGKVETKELHEVWWFNKDGKISAMRQWTSKFGK